MNLEGAIRFWDPATGKLLRTQPGVEAMDPIDLSDLSFDGKRLAVIVEEGLRVHEGKKVLWRTNPERDGLVLNARFSPDGRLLAVAYPDGVVVCDSATGKSRLVLPLNQPGEQNPHLSWSRDSKMLCLAVTERNEATVYEVATGRPRQRIQGALPGGVAFSQDGRHLVLVSTTGHIRVQELGVDRPCLALRTGEVPMLALALSPDGTRLAGARDSVVRVWNMAGKQLAAFPGHDGPILDLAFSPDGRALISASEDGTALVWNVPSAETRAKTTPVLWKGDSWKTLAHEDSAQAFQAMRALRQQPAEAVKLFQTHLMPAGTADARRVERLLAGLDSDDFQTRQKAEADLRSLDTTIEATLRSVLEKPPSVQVQKTVECLLDGIEANSNGPERLREQRAVEVLEWLNTPEARALLEKLASGGPSRLTLAARETLQRLASLP